MLERLWHLGEAGEPFERLPVVLAAWFHDSVYDGERDAEERSAAWAEDALPALTDPETVAEVVRLVRLTETHRPADDDANGCALSDADLGILAATPERYAAYVARGAHRVRPPRRRDLPRRAQPRARPTCSPSRGCSTPAPPSTRGRPPPAPTRRLSSSGSPPADRQTCVRRRRSPAAISALTSSRELTGVAPASTMASYHSEGTS